MLVSSSWFLFLRRITRKIGINKVLSSFISSVRGGNYEDRFGPALARQIQVGDTVWDVGANVGRHLIPMAKKVSPDGHVYAFEPVPMVYTELKHRVEDDNNLSKNITLFPYALYDNNGQTDFCVAVDVPSFSGILERTVAIFCKYFLV